jgi:hypothetical protein
MGGFASRCCYPGGFGDGYIKRAISVFHLQSPLWEVRVRNHAVRRKVDTLETTSVFMYQIYLSVVCYG